MAFEIAVDLDKLAIQGKKYSQKEAQYELSDAIIKAILEHRTLIKKLVPPQDLSKLIVSVFESAQVKRAFAGITGGDLAPRVIGSAVMGATQLAADWVKMLLTRY